MVFSSAVFLFLFLPVVLIAHTFIRNNNVRNGLLIAGSLVFYAFGEPLYVALLLASVFVNYLFGRALATHKSKPLLAVAVILNVLLLVAVKYLGLLVETVNLLPFVALPVPKITMPIGVSFFTFQAISYVVDTYRREEGEPESFFKVLLYICLFPQLIAGPIVKYNSIKTQLSDRSVTTDKMAAGIRRFIIGLAKKMLIANQMAVVADGVFGMEAGSLAAPVAWLGAVCYTLQIYFDFSGYSDMALGLGKCFGFDFPENFNYPYSASGIRDFWRRWHMSLTGWFREYVYIPLGGNRKGKARTLLNTMIVFVCTGVWHGANLTFIAWGAYHGILMCVETLLTRNKKEFKINPLKWIYTMFFVIIGFVIFRADNIGYAFSYIGRMFVGGSAQTAISYMTPMFLTALSGAVIAMFPIVPMLAKKNNTVLKALSYVASLGLLVLCIMTLAADSYNPFIYFRF